MKRSWFFIILLTIISLLLAGTAAYFSIFGLSKLFVGAGVGIIILASVLEAAKLTAVSYVYRYWKHLEGLIKSYFVAGIIIIMLITSLGIYGYLTGSYQMTANKVEYRDSQIKIAQNKKDLFVAQLDRINKTIESDNNRINQLSNIRGTQERRLDSLYSRKQNRSFTEKSITSADEQIKLLNADITEKMKQSNAVNDSISYYDNEIVVLKTSDVSNEVGPLKFISDFTGWSMSTVVNILVLLLIFVFDPMAIIMLISVNKLTMLEKGESTTKEDRIKLPKIKFPIKNKNVKDIKKEDKKEIYSPPYMEYEDKQEEDDDIEDDDLDEEDFIEEDSIIEEDNSYDEIKTKLDPSDIKEGLTVHHDTFGKGIIKKINEDRDRVFIKFEDYGNKELSPEYANLQEIKRIKKEDIESVKYIDFEISKPEVHDVIKEDPEKKTKFIQKIWKGKKII